MSNTEVFNEQNPYIHGELPRFHQYLDKQKDFVKAKTERNEARTAWRQRAMPLDHMMKAACFAQAAEMISERTVMHYQSCMTEDEAKIIQQWTGSNPEISVEYFQEVVEHLQSVSLKFSQCAVDHQNETEKLEADLNEKQAVVSKLFDGYRVKYNELQESRKEVNE